MKLKIVLLVSVILNILMIPVIKGNEDITPFRDDFFDELKNIYPFGQWLQWLLPNLNITVNSLTVTSGLPYSNITLCPNLQILQVAGGEWTCIPTPGGGAGESKWVDNGSALTPNVSFANSVNLSEAGGFLDVIGDVYIGGIPLGARFIGIGNNTGNTSTEIDARHQLANYWNATTGIKLGNTSLEVWVVVDNGTYYKLEDGMSYTNITDSPWLKNTTGWSNYANVSNFWDGFDTPPSQWGRGNTSLEIWIVINNGTYYKLADGMSYTNITDAPWIQTDTNASSICATDQVLLGNESCVSSSEFFDDTTIADTSNTTEEMRNAIQSMNPGYKDINNVSGGGGNTTSEIITVVNNSFINLTQGFGAINGTIIGSLKAEDARFDSGIIDSGSAQVIDTENNLLISGGTNSLEWKNRQLLNDNGNVALDWGTPGISSFDNNSIWDIRNLTAQTGIFNNITANKISSTILTDGSNTITITQIVNYFSNNTFQYNISAKTCAGTDKISAYSDGVFTCSAAVTGGGNTSAEIDVRHQLANYWNATTGIKLGNTSLEVWVVVDNGTYYKLEDGMSYTNITDAPWIQTDTNASSICTGDQVLLGNESCESTAGYMAVTVTNATIDQQINDSNITWGEIVGFTDGTYNGNLSSGSLEGYAAGHKICNEEFEGSHHCLEVEVMKTNINDLLIYTGNFWVSKGAPGYLAEANDCSGWRSDDGAKLGPFWNFDGNNWIGYGVLTNCASNKKLACCK